MTKPNAYAEECTNLDLLSFDVSSQDFGQKSQSWFTRRSIDQAAMYQFVQSRLKLS